MVSVTLVYPCVGWALPCPKIEFAELQSKSRAQLEGRYCQSLVDGGFAEERFYSKLKFRGEFSAIGARREADMADREAKEAQEEAAQCRDEAVRALDVLAKRFKKRAPDCSKTIPAWKHEWALDAAAGRTWRSVGSD